jgi:hypothetical protein
MVKKMRRSRKKKKKRRRCGDEEKGARREEGRAKALKAIGEDIGETGKDIEGKDAEGDVVDPPGNGVEGSLGIALLVHHVLQQHTQHQLPVHRHRRYHVDETQSR